jgi:hypothetical protein
MFSVFLILLSYSCSISMKRDVMKKGRLNLMSQSRRDKSCRSKVLDSI